MENQFDMFFNKIKSEMEQQTQLILQRVDEQIKKLLIENVELREKLEKSEIKIKNLEEKNRRKNLIVYGITEKNDIKQDQIENFCDIIENDLSIKINKNEVENAHRLGKSMENKDRPLLVSFITKWKREEIFRNKKKLRKGIYILEDFSKEILEKRKELQQELLREREKGKIAYLKSDKLIVKERTETRKRDLSISPNTPREPGKHLKESNAATITKRNKKDAFQIMKQRQSASQYSKHSI